MALHRSRCKAALAVALGVLLPLSAQDRPERPDRPDRQDRRDPPKNRTSQDSPRPLPPPRPPDDRRPPPDRRPQERGSQPPWQDRHDRPPLNNPPPRPYQNDPTSTRLGGYPAQHRTREQARGWQQQRGWRSEGAWGEHHSWREHRARQWQNEHRSWGQRGGYGGYYIPEDQFRLHFGNQHGFRIHNRPSIYGGYPRFHYGGFWFMLVDPWPEFWPENWYSTDDVYLDYSDGYYLYNRRYPGFGIAVTVSF